MKQVIIVGGGASSLAAAIAARTKGLSVLVLERNNQLGKKLSMTGNGRCNYGNVDRSLVHFHSAQLPLFEEIWTAENQEKLFHFFDELGIIPKIKNGYYYPYSNQAFSIIRAFELEAKDLGVVFEKDCLVRSITKDKEKFLLNTSKGIYQADSLILATGSKAYSKTGSDGNGYLLAEVLGHTIVPVLPSLVPLYGKEEKVYKFWSGVRCEAQVSLYEEGKLITTKQGELQLTSYGISGICVFDLSGLVAKGLIQKKKEEIRINFLPFLGSTKKEFGLHFLDERSKIWSHRTLEELLEVFLPYKLVLAFFQKIGFSKDQKWQELSLKKQKEFVSLLLAYPFEVVKTGDFEQAQVCSGGVSLLEINRQTMESLKVKNLYFAGEILDVDGDCGGYNLMFAFLSGLLAGEGIK